jgi:hypothetical protein
MIKNKIFNFKVLLTSLLAVLFFSSLCGTVSADTWVKKLPVGIHINHAATSADGKFQTVVGHNGLSFYPDAKTQIYVSADYGSTWTTKG